jgi:hypothetical protein
MVKYELYDETEKEVINRQISSVVRELPAIGSKIRYKTFLPGDPKENKGYYEKIDYIKTYEVVGHEYDMEESWNNSIVVPKVRIILQLIDKFKPPVL